MSKELWTIPRALALDLDPDPPQLFRSFPIFHTHAWIYLLYASVCPQTNKLSDGSPWSCDLVPTGPNHISRLLVGDLKDHRELEEAPKDLKTEEELIDLATDGA